MLVFLVGRVDDCWRAFWLVLEILESLDKPLKVTLTLHLVKEHEEPLLVLEFRDLHVLELVGINLVQRLSCCK